MGSSRNPVIAVLVVCFIASWPARAQNVEQKSEVGAKPKTILDLSVEELRRKYRAELRELAFVEDQEGLRLLLSRTGDNVEAFFHNVQNTASKEQILSQRLKVSGSIESSSNSTYNYLLLAHPDVVGSTFEEDRADDRNRPVKLGRLSEYAVTSGFAGQCVILHPSHQYGSRFRYLGRTPSAQVIAFAQKPEAGDFLNYINGADATPVLVQGVVWIDPVTFQIVRMRTDLLEPDWRNGVASQTTESWFTEVRFEGLTRSFWLPRRVLVTMEYRQKIFRNEHSYSNYRLFSVSSFDKIVKP